MKNTIAERIFDFLKNYPPFDLLAKEQLTKVSEKVVVKYLEINSSVFMQEETAHDHFYIVQEGAIGLYRTVLEEEVLVDICDEGDVFGLRPLIHEDCYRLSAIAKEESILYAIPVDLLKSFIVENEGIHKFIMASFATNIRNPHAKNNNAELFANEFSLKRNNDNYVDVQTAEYSKTPITCFKNNSIQEAATIMSIQKVGSIVITEQDKPIGIITDKDLRMKIATGKVAITEKVASIMSSPVITFPENISVAEAQIAMIKNRITHLCITEDGSPNSKLVGLLSEHDIVVLNGKNPSVLIKEIKRAKSVETLIHVRQKASEILKAYIEQNIPIYFVSKIMAEINDALTIKAIDLSIEELKQQPPVKFSWLALGSQGRKEQLLITDQDNALVFENVAEADYDKTKTYFLKLAEKVTDKLNKIGYEMCPADMMASNPSWCLSVDEWKAQFDSWITKPTEQTIMMCTIFFDYTRIYGSQTLVSQITESIYESIESYEIFLNFLGRNALQSPPPVGFFRQFIVENNGENKDQFDLKSRALMPLIDGARLLVLSHQIAGENNTIERFEALIAKEPQNKDLYFACIDSFKIILRYRTKQGIKHQDSGRFVAINNLTKGERLKLKACFNPIKDLQELLTVRFQLAQIM